MHLSLLTASSSLLSPAMNESKPKTTLLSFFFFVFFFTSGFAKPLQYQTLSLGSLPNPSKLNLEDDDLSWSESSQTLTSPESSSETNPSSLTLRLEHRDALSSNETPQSLFNLRLLRDETRVKTLIAASNAQVSKKNVSHSAHGSKDGFSSSIISGLSQGSGEYFTRLGVGTPPKYNFMVLDTGSDVVWLQCAPCRKCYSQSDPIFDPKRSGTFVSLSCSSSLCKKLDVSGCNQRKACLYQVNYGDGSFTVGEFSTETLTFRGTKVPNVALGCGHDNEGLFVGAAGLLGLGRGTLSFPSQAGRSFGGKFSYCLVDRTSSVPSKQSSSMVFGESSVPGTALFTPMLSNPKLDTFYYLSLLGISVGGTRVRGIRDSMFKIDPNGSGGVIIDSGTSVTRLDRPAYIAFRDAFRSGATGLKIAPGYSLFDTCFDLSGKSEVKVPTVVMHFGGGADLALPASNYLIPVNTNGTFCFAFAGTSGGLSIIGNIQQQGFRVIFDSAGSRIGFAPRGCS